MISIKGRNKRDMRQLVWAKWVHRGQMILTTTNRTRAADPSKREAKKMNGNAHTQDIGTSLAYFSFLTAKEAAQGLRNKNYNNKKGPLVASALHKKRKRNEGLERSASSGDAS